MTNWEEIINCSVCGKNKAEFDCKDGNVCLECASKLPNEMKKKGKELTVEEIKETLFPTPTPVPHTTNAPPEKSLPIFKLLLIFIGFIVLIGGVTIYASLSSSDEIRKSNTVKFDALQYWDKYEDDVIKELGEPDNTEFREHTASNKMWYVKSLCYGDTEFVFMERDGKLMYVNISDSFPYKEKEDILQRLGLNKTEDTKSEQIDESYWIYNCPISAVEIWGMDANNITNVNVWLTSFDDYETDYYDEDEYTAQDATGSYGYVYGTIEVTYSQYQQIDSGMSYDEVVSIFGGKGVITAESNDNYTGNISAVGWDGFGSVGANLTITFVNGKVQSKAQFGLK